MLEPINQLTEEDKQTIKEYICSYGKCGVVDLNITLNEWNKNKKRLFKLFGNKLRVKIPISIKRTNSTYERMLNEIYTIPGISYINSGWPEYLNNQKEKVDNMGYKPDFIYDLAIFMDNLLNNENKITYKDLSALYWIISYSNIISGKINSMDYCWFIDKKDNQEASYTFRDPYGNKNIKLTRDVKVIKIFQKILKMYKYNRWDLFEEFRNKLSNLSTGANIDTNLVLSIHPIDFMTMSDNNCGWHSCMSWKENGCYSNGTIEMMNSNIVVVSYLESSTPFLFNYHKIPNKSWRMLAYVTKDIILSGKPYPYSNKELSIEVVKQLAKMVKEKFNWKYSYKGQEYYDLMPYGCDDFLYNSYKYFGKKSILMKTNGMYNDLLEDHSCFYYCYRNYVPKTKVINASGKCTCLICGKEIRNIGSNDKYCSDCYEKYYCSSCKTVHPENKIYKVNILYKYGKALSNICEKCSKDYFYDKKYDLSIEKEYLYNIKNIFSNIVILDDGRQEELDKKLENMLRDFCSNGRFYYSYERRDIFKLLKSYDIYFDVIDLIIKENIKYTEIIFSPDLTTYLSLINEKNGSPSIEKHYISSSLPMFYYSVKSDNIEEVKDLSLFNTKNICTLSEVI